MHWRKSPRPPSDFNAYLAGWAIAFSVNFGNGHGALAAWAMFRPTVKMKEAAN
jgi:hypothetical protein